MKARDIFHKTATGQSEVATKSNALTLTERRVLILVNGVNDAATLKEILRCDNIIEVLENLMTQGFIERGGNTDSKHDYARHKP